MTKEIVRRWFIDNAAVSGIVFGDTLYAALKAVGQAAMTGPALRRLDKGQEISVNGQVFRFEYEEKEVEQ